MYDNVIGIDVWCKTLHLYSSKKKESSSIKNTIEQIGEYLQLYVWMNTLVMYEATWAYSNNVLKVCNTLCMKHYQIHPTQLSQVCKWLGKMNKTDRLDAKAIASIWLLMLDHMWTLTTPSTNENKELLWYLSSINSLKKMRKTHKNLIHKVGNDAFWDTIIVSFLEEQGNVIGNKIEELMTIVETRLEWLWYKEKLKNMRTIPWIWRDTAIYLLLFFIDLKEKWIEASEKRKVVSYAWLNPVEQQSGTSLQRTKLSKKWRAIVREVMYMPMMNRYKLENQDHYKNTTLGKFFTRMREKFESWESKRSRSIICAMMKKTLVTAWSIFWNDTEYNRS